MYRILDATLRLMAPVLSFTIDEAWSHFNRPVGAPTHVFLARLPEAGDFPEDGDLMQSMATFREVRDVVLKSLEDARVAKTIGHPLEARVTVRVKDGGAYDKAVSRFEAILPELFVTSRSAVERVESLPGVDAPAEAVVEPIDEERCARCWNRFEDVGANPNHPDLCARCADVMESNE